MNRQLSLLACAPADDDSFRFTWHNTREGVAVWIEHRGNWRTGVVVHLGRQYVSVMLTDYSGRTVYARRAYGELRRRVVKPKLVEIGKA